MATQTDLSTLHDQLRAILEPYASKLVTTRSDARELWLSSHVQQQNRKPLFFGAVRRKTGSVAFHLMPIYTHPALLEGLSDGLRARLKGKGCFDFTARDRSLLKELKTLTRRAFAVHTEHARVITAERAVEQYLALLPRAARTRLQQVQAIVRKVAPKAVHAFSYGIPGFTLEGKPLVWYAAFKEHHSLYPMTEAIRRAHARALEGYGVSKGTVRFPLATPLPVSLVTRLVKARLAEMRMR